MEDPLVSLATAEHCFDVQFHPRRSLLAAATVTGQVELHSFRLPEAAEGAEGSSELVRKLRCHKKSCRTARFLCTSDAASGSAAAAGDDSTARLVSTGADCFAALMDVEEGKRIWRAKLEAAGNALLPLKEQRFALGDDGGGISIYDVRQKKPSVRYTENEDFVSDMALGKDGYSLCATSGDGTFAVYDLRLTGEKALVAMSDFQEDEFLSLAVMRQGTKVVCGSQTGVLAIFSWGDFGDQKDRIKGHPMSVDAMVKLSEDCIITGSSDGRVRVVAVFHKEHGNRVLGSIAEHGEYPVERLAMSPDQQVLASASHGQPAVRLWSLEAARKLLSGDSKAAPGAEDEQGSDSDEEPRSRKKKKKKRKVENDSVRKANHFFSGL